MPTLFLSHTSVDKPMVRKLAVELQAWGIDVWLDEWRIKVGESITQSVQHGIDNSDQLAIWITRRALESTWVEREWRTKIFQEINERKVLVLPLLAENVRLPVFLGEKKYADFRKGYISGLKELADTLDCTSEFEESVSGQIHGDWIGESPGLGKVHLIVQGTRVEGSYEWLPLQSSGRLVGEIVDGRLVCRWFNGGDGCALLEISDDRLIGSWWGGGISPSYFAMLKGALPSDATACHPWSMRRLSRQ